MIGKWNKSVIVTYVGMLLAVASIFLLMSGFYKAAMMCFMGAGICDLFDGTIARMCKRTEEEKNFGIQLDSLVDVVSFIVLPVVLIVKLAGFTWYAAVAAVLYSVFGIARLAYFNVCQEENEDKDSPIKYYTGMPVTYAALVFPLVYLLHLYFNTEVTALFMCIAMEIMAVLFILKIKFIKPGKKGYIFLILLAIALFAVYIIFVR
ncbi:MAG: CDP-alcohol phosphatidyltransferase family protein [Oscillospiraceae bacterium]|nr:CDP-alcohol phosphatidyltransferase family protein [Oscillospiraceae bacterium]